MPSGLALAEGETLGSYAKRLVQRDLHDADASGVVNLQDPGVQEQYRKKGITELPPRFILSAAAAEFDLKDMYMGVLERTEREAGELKTAVAQKEKVAEIGAQWAVQIRSLMFGKRDVISGELSRDRYGRMPAVLSSRLISGADHEMNRIKQDEKKARMENPETALMQNLYNLGRENKDEKIARLTQELNNCRSSRKGKKQN